MAIYSITVIDGDGNRFVKTLDFADEIELYNYVDTVGMEVLDIRQKPFYYKYISFGGLFGKITSQEVTEILENLQVIVRSGLPLNTGLLDLAKDTENSAAASMLSEVAFKVQSGSTLSGALEKYKKVLGETAVSLVRIGEETGSLDVTLKDAANHIKKIHDLKSKAKLALIYPVFSFFGLMAAMIFWLIVVMPQIMGAFAAFDIELPPTTRFIQWLSAFLSANIVFIAGIFAALAALVVIGRRRWVNFRYQTDRFFLKVPLMGALQSNFNLAFFSEYVRLMIAAGLPLYQALNVIGDSLGNEVFKRAVKNSMEAIAGGATFSDALKKENIFPSLVVRMLGVGEQTGGLEEQLGYISGYYYNKVDYLSQNIAKVIEPLIIIVIGVCMLVIMVGLLGPIYNLIGNVSSSY